MPFITKELEKFPPGNPFHYDAISMGIRLKDAVVVEDRFDPEWQQHCYIMHASERLASGLYIVNAQTGDRLGIGFED